jgi:nickel-dependent lactate racemase
VLIELAYGRQGLTVELPDKVTTVIEPTHVPGLPDQRGALLNAIRNPIGTPPLRQLVSPDQTVAISVCDITRPMPSATVLPVLLRDLAHVPDEQITIVIATGTHRSNTPDELEQMLGIEVMSDYRVLNHDAFADSSLKHVGDTPEGIPIWLNRHWVESDIRITTGFVEPHFFAGFSGGPKMVAPGLAGLVTTMRLHDAQMIGHPNSTWGVTEGNPIHSAIRQIARQTGVDFSVDVTINRDHQITAAYAGELFAVHRAACGVAKRAAMRAVSGPFDVVVTTTSGYPLDLNLYQSVKGMSAAAQVLKDGGSIICAAECSDGIPDHGDYKKILSEADSPQDLLETINAPGYSRHDQWQVQIQAQIQMRAEVYLRSSYLTDEQVRRAHLKPIEDIEGTVSDMLRRHGRGARVCVLPQGPQTIPYLRDR